MKQKKTAAAVIAAMLAGFAAAKAPEIDPALVDTLVAQIMQQADRHAEQSQKPDGQAIRNDAVRRLQTLEVLKNRALKEGLDKDKDVQNRFKIAEASFYAEEYVRFLERSETVSESALRQFYERQIRMIKLQQVSFATEEEARQAQQLLLKGLSFEGLMKRYPNDEQAFDVHYGAAASRAAGFAVCSDESGRRYPRSGQIGRTLLSVQTQRGREKPRRAAFRVGQKPVGTRFETGKSPLENRCHFGRKRCQTVMAFPIPMPSEAFSDGIARSGKEDGLCVRSYRKR